MKKLINNIINLFGYSFIKLERVNDLLNSNKLSIEDINFVNDFEKQKQDLILELLKKSRSQQFQDVVALYLNNFVRNGYYVEIGVGDGFQNSNSYILERDYNWNGILVEPSKQFHKKLSKRKGYLEKKLIYDVNDRSFEFYQSGLLSTIEKYLDGDQHSSNRLRSVSYPIKSMTLETLLKKYNSPKVINYISIDTEGSEFDIIKNFNFNLYDIKFVTIEHNFNKQKRIMT